MKVLFILPPLSEKGSLGFFPRFAPYLTASAAAHLRKKDCIGTVFDAFLEDASFEKIGEVVSQEKPDIIVIPLVEVNREVPLCIAHSLIRYLKKSFPDSNIIGFGSSDIDSIKESVCSEKSLDFYVVGDPEQTLTKLALLLSQDKTNELPYCEGLLFRKDNKTIFTGRAVIENIDCLEFPAWDLAGIDKYQTMPHRYKKRKIYLLASSRGCRWGKCIFCEDINSITRNTPYRTKSPRRIVEEILYAQKKYGCEEIQFYDQQFNTEKNWVLELKSELEKNKVRIPWSCLCRIDSVTKEALALMHSMGCWNILFGIESCNDRLLGLLNKGITAHQIKIHIEN